MVAAATALCLDSTNVHRQSTKQSVAFISLAASAIIDQKMALNFGVSATGKLLNSSPPVSTDAPKSTKMDTLLVSNAHLQNIPQVSPGTAALRKITEALALSSATPSPATPNSQQPLSADENSLGSNEASIQKAELLKDQLMKAINKNDFDEVSRLITEIEMAHLTKNALECSRIGMVVNTLRRNIANTHPDLAKKCRSLIKSWRSNVEALNCSSRPSSSCGSSSGTPALVSPAIRLKITPRGKTITPTSQLAYEGFSANASYAPSTASNKTSPQMAPIKRKASVVSPNANQTALKRAKLSPTVASAQTISVIEARRNVQSTDSLAAAMGIDKFLSSSVEKKPEESVQVNGLVKSDPISIPSIQSLEKRGRKKREPGAPQTPVVPRLKIRFGGKSAEEHDAEEASKRVDINAAIPSTSTAMPPNSRQSVGKKPNKKSTKEPSKPEFSWYNKLPSVEELELRKPSELNVDKTSIPTDPTICKIRERTIVLMPYLEDDGPDFLLYDYPDKERFMAQKRRF